MRIKCRAYFPVNAVNQFGFYGLPNEPHRRIRNGEEFYFDYDEKKHKIAKLLETDENGNDIERQMIGSWVEVMEMPKKTLKKATSEGLVA